MEGIKKRIGFNCRGKYTVEEVSNKVYDEIVRLRYEIMNLNRRLTRRISNYKERS